MARRRHRWDPVCDPPATLTRPVPVDPTGRRGPTKSQAARAGAPGSPWRRSSPGRFVPAAVDDDLPEQRVLEMHEMLRGRGAVTGWGSLRLQGATFCDGLAPDGRTRVPVQLVIGPHDRRRPRDGVRWLQDRLDDDEVFVRQSMRVTKPERATFDAMRLAGDVREAVIGLEMAIAAELTSIRRMARYVVRHPGRSGVPQARAALGLADERSRSPGETRMRLIWLLDAGLPRPLVNQEVFSRDGRLLGVVDLLDVEAGVVGEYDGGDHAAARRRSDDASREGGLRNHGLEVFRLTGFDVLDPRRAVPRMHGARRRARWEPASRRRWTVTPPEGWPVARSLDETIDHRDFLAACEETWARDRAL